MRTNLGACRCLAPYYGGLIAFPWKKQPELSENGTGTRLLSNLIECWMRHCRPTLEAATEAYPTLVAATDINFAVCRWDGQNAASWQQTIPIALNVICRCSECLRQLRQKSLESSGNCFVSRAAESDVYVRDSSAAMVEPVTPVNKPECRVWLKACLHKVPLTAGNSWRRDNNGGRSSVVRASEFKAKDSGFDPLTRQGEGQCFYP